MTMKEERRRQICRYVFKKAWILKSRTSTFIYSFGTCLKLSWQIVRSQLRLEFTKIVGVSFQNQHGINRQTLLKRLLRYSYKQISLYFQREPNNPIDPNAVKVIAVVSSNSQVIGSSDIGYLPKDHALCVAPLLDAGKQSFVFLDSIYGNPEKSYGCRLCYAVL